MHQIKIRFCKCNHKSLSKIEILYKWRCHIFITSLYPNNYENKYDWAHKKAGTQNGGKLKRTKVAVIQHIDIYIPLESSRNGILFCANIT